MNVYLLVLLIIGNFLLQSTIFQYFRIAGILPNTALVIIVIISILNGRKKGITAGIITGLLQDLFFSRAIGVNTLIYMLIGYIIGGFEKKLFKDNLLTPIFLITVSTFFYHSVYFLLMYFLNQPFNFLFVLRKIALIEAIYNLFIGIFIYKCFYKQLYRNRYK